MVTAQLMCPALTHLQEQSLYLAYYYSRYYCIWPTLVFAGAGHLTPHFILWMLCVAIIDSSLRKGVTIGSYMALSRL